MGYKGQGVFAGKHGNAAAIGIDGVSLKTIFGSNCLKREVDELDERELIRSAIAHINEAKSEIEFFSARNISPGSKQALDEAYRSLNNCIRHCQAIFGPATDEAKSKL